MGQEGTITIAAPFGLDDLFSLTMRPNPRCIMNPHFAAKAKALKSQVTLAGDYHPSSRGSSIILFPRRLHSLTI
jgi:hypothetical protein